MTDNYDSLAQSSSDDFYNSLTHKEKSVFHMYKSNEGMYCNRLNAMLQGQGDRDEALANDANVLSQIISKYIGDRPKKVYRGSDARVISSIDVGTVFQSNSFWSSCEIELTVAKFFGECPALFEITCSENAPMAPFEPDEYGGLEHEWLIQTGASFRLVGKEQIDVNHKRFKELNYNAGGNEKPILYVKVTLHGPTENKSDE